MAAGWRHTSAVITGPNVSAVIQSAARLERGRTLNNGFDWTQLDQIWHAGGREGREGREGRAGQGRAGQGRAGQGRAGQGRAGVVNVLIITMPVNGNVTLLWCHLTDKSNVTF